jgi:Uma2 family endonuclease
MATTHLSTTHLIPVGEYLGSTYRPDVDYVDGRIEERNVGDYDHADLQSELLFLLRFHEKEWKIRALAEVRVQVSATRYRIPDVCVTAEDAPRTPVIQHPPLLCLEVLSPRDSVAAMRRRVQDYFDMGVPAVWIFDPATRTAYACSPDTMTEHKDGVLQLAGSCVMVSIAEVFGRLDKI